jgi:hypothetical protein
MREKLVEGGYGYGIYEWYPRIGKTGPGWTQDPIDPYGETIEELRSDFKHMAMAFKHPVLDHETGKPIRRKK